MNEHWKPPDLCLTSLMVFVTVLAVVASAFHSTLLWSSVRRGLLPPFHDVCVWLLYAAVVATSVKALVDWERERKARRFAGEEDRANRSADGADENEGR